MSRTIIIEKEIYTFDELSNSAKEKARAWYREGDETYAEMEPYETAAEILGISNIDIRYSGFWSQGDGASFTGNYSNSPNAPENIRQEFGTDTTLCAIADELTALQVGCRLSCGKFMQAAITQSGNYYHSGSIDIETPGGEEDALFDEDRETALLCLIRRFADWIYKSLEKEYYYHRSDEAVDENIQANEYEFTEDGEII